MQVQVLKLNNYKNTIFECFSTDNDFIDKWHKDYGPGLENCVNNTYNELTNLNLDFFTLYDDNKLVGYFYIEKDFLVLTGFFIKPVYRKKEYIKEFWNIVNNKFENKSFLIGIYDINIPAINFIKYNGGKEVNKTKNAIIFLVNGDK